MKALKNFGLGLVWVFLIPFIAVAVVVVGLFGIINFFVQFVIMVINFFRGKKLFPMFDEDEEAYEILQKAIDRKKASNQISLKPRPLNKFSSNKISILTPQAQTKVKGFLTPPKTHLSRLTRSKIHMGIFLVDIKISPISLMGKCQIPILR